MNKRATIVLALFLAFIESKSIEKQKNNVCTTMEGYFNLDTSPDCYFEEDYTLMAPELIRKYAGILESHEVTTEDGYTLTMFRIPRENPKGVVLLQHPLNTNSDAYTVAGNQSMAISLWLSGYDVWLNNHRGTNYSLHQTKWSALQYEYWNFSFHEIAIFDMPAQVELMRAHTNNSRIIFYGYSMGATAGLAYTTLFPEKAREYFKVFVYAGIACYFKYNSSPVMLAGLFADSIAVIYEYLKLGTAVPIVQSVRYIAKYFVTRFPELLNYETHLINLSFGPSRDSLNPLSTPTDIIGFIDYFSWRTMVHILQLTRSKDRFQWYDYGTKKNLEYYGTEEPPEYPVRNITVPTYIISGDTDKLTTAKDADLLFERLRPEAQIYGKKLIPGVNHIDYAFGRHAKEYLIDELIRFLETI